MTLVLLTVQEFLFSEFSQVIAVAKSSDLVLMVLDASKVSSSLAFSNAVFHSLCC